MELHDGMTQLWDRRWIGSEEKERLTLLGRTMFRSKRKTLLSLAATLPVKTVIEVGCGLGHTLGVYMEAGLQATGIDISPSAVAVCRKKGLPAVLKDVVDETGTYDLVSSDGMLEHFLHFEPMAAQLMRISRRYVLLIQPNHGSFTGKTLAYLAELLRGHENIFEYNYRISDFIAVFDRQGFRLRKSLPVFRDVFRVLLFENPERAEQVSTQCARPAGEDR